MPKYREMLNHEFRRPRNDEWLCDVYDGSAWKELFGPPVFPNDRIGLLFCIDGIPAFNKENGKSLKPGFLMNLSLPPSERIKPKYIHMWFVMPTDIKGISQKKYYDFLAAWELNDLHFNGSMSASIQ